MKVFTLNYNDSYYVTHNGVDVANLWIDLTRLSCLGPFDCSLSSTGIWEKGNFSEGYFYPNAACKSHALKIS